jgi:Ca2+/Na+ antiporter
VKKITFFAFFQNLSKVIGHQNINFAQNFKNTRLMKKFLFILMAFVATTFSALAATVTVTFNNGQNMEGQLVNLTDTTLVLRAYYAATGDKEITILPERVKYFHISGIGRYNVEEGKFVPDAKAQAKLEKTRGEREAHAKLVSERAANPNLVIGNALKKTGGVCMGIGIPSAIVGAILVGVGNSGTDSKDVSKLKTKANCAAAGYVLLPMGAALTIVGIPLNVHGKRIAEMNINYTGNGAGVSVNF